MCKCGSYIMEKHLISWKKHLVSWKTSHNLVLIFEQINSNLDSEAH